MHFKTIEGLYLEALKDRSLVSDIYYMLVDVQEFPSEETMQRVAQAVVLGRVPPQ